MQLRKLADDLWGVEDLLPMPGTRFPVRSAVVRLRSGGLVILSPLPGLAALKPELDALGPTQAFIGPCTLHHLGLEGAHQAWPQAALLSRQSLQRRRKDLPWTRLLTDAPDALWAGELEQEPVGGMPGIDETVFFHRASGTLLVADVSFNVLEMEGFFARLFMKLNDAYGRFGPSRIARSMVKDRAALRRSIDRMLAWNPTRIVPCHGAVLEADARAALERAFAFLPAVQE
ncbi:MAG: DUF4336 domain-containing protein [Deltaproteobacteria bacterium]|nr:DUF4336 domain-containing protein [Deltaproteobacteria bacterium]